MTIETTLTKKLPEGGQASSDTTSNWVILQSLFREPTTFFAIAFLLILLACTFFAEWIAPYDPLAQNLRMRNKPPLTPAAQLNDFPHLLGTDALGRDLLSRLIYGSRISLSVGLSSAIVSGVIGIFLGLMAGYFGGKIDTFIMRFVDLQMSFPFLLLALLVLLAIGPGFWNIVLILALVRWMVYARVARGLVLAYRESAFVDGARITGNSDWRIIFRHLLPNVASPLLILATLEMAELILGEASLSFLGFGVQPPTPSWGLMINEGTQYVSTAWWLVTFPGLAILLTTLSLNLIAGALRSSTDPVQREQWLTRVPRLVPDLSRTTSPKSAEELSKANSHLLAVSDLYVEFRTVNQTVKAVNGISYTLDEGETLAILGESGSGKSVSAEAVMGLIETPPGYITRGTVKFRGLDLLTLSDAERRKIQGQKIAMIFQDPQSALNPVYTVGHQVAEMLQRHRGLSKKAAREKAIELMERVHIPSARERANDYPHQFSGGMAQRVMIAIALALEPEILIADEPTTALDVTVQAQVMKLLAELQAELGMGLVLITHDLGVVADVADRLVVMYAGRIMESGSVFEIYEKPAHPYTVGLMQSMPRRDHKGNKLEPIPGSPPRATDIPSGCPFHPRCRLAQEKCQIELPLLHRVSEGRYSACHFYKEVLDDGG